MLKVCGLVLVLTTILLLGCETKPGNGTPTPTPAITPTVTPASPTPTLTPTPTTTPTPSTASVKGSNFKWQDDASGTPITTIKVGGTVTWTITQGTHKLEKVPAGNGCAELPASFTSGNLSSGQTVTRTFNTAGTFGYHCGIHGGTPNCTNTSQGTDMWGIIKVVP